MATIQFSGFTKKGSLNWGSCTLYQTDSLGLDIGVTFETGEIGTMDCFAYITLPDGSQKSVRMSHYIGPTTPLPMTWDFTASIQQLYGTLQIGNYILGEVQVFNRESGNMLTDVVYNGV